MKKRKIFYFLLILVLLAAQMSTVASVGFGVSAGTGDSDTAAILEFSQKTAAIARRYDGGADFKRGIVLDDGLTDYNGVPMTDAETFAELSGGAVNYADSDTVEITLNDRSVTLTAGSRDAKTQDGALNLSVAPRGTTANGRRSVLLPASEVAEALGYEVIQNDGGGLIMTRPFQTRRLIATGKVENDYGAIERADGYKDYTVLQYATEDAARSAYERLSQTVDVFPDEIFYVADADSDNDSGSDESVDVAPMASASPVSYNYNTWGASDYMMRFNGFNTAINAAVGVNALPTVTVAVLDTGIYSAHTLFSGRIAEGGRNFTTEGDGINDVDDEHSHGTHVAGIIADLTLPNVKILPIKVMSANGNGSSLDIINGINYVISKKNELNIVAINMSLGGATTYTGYNAPINNAYSAGIFSVVAAGNDNKNANDYMPAAVEKAITVSSIDSTKQRSTFSNYGTVVDVAAPGSNIRSAVPPATDSSLYASYNGTSMAAPHVAALVAALRSDPKTDGYSMSATEEVIFGNVQDLGVNGKDPSFGHGLARVPVFTAETSPDDPAPPAVTMTASAGVGGSVTPNGTFTLAYGASQTFTLLPASGYEVKSVTFNGVTTETSATVYTVDNLTLENNTFNVQFKAKTDDNVRVIVTTTQGGGVRIGHENKAQTITSPGIISTATGNQSLALLSTDANFKFKAYYIDGVKQTGRMSSLLVNFQADSVMHIECEPKNSSLTKHTVTASTTESGGGNIYPAQSVSVVEGGEQAYLLLPADGYKLRGLTVNGEFIPHTDLTYTLAGVSQNTSVQAQFVPLDYQEQEPGNPGDEQPENPPDEQPNDPVNPGDNPGEQPTDPDNPGDNPGEQPTDPPGEEPTNPPGEEPENPPDEQPENPPDEQPENPPDEQPNDPDNPDDNPGEGTESDPTLPTDPDDTNAPDDTETPNDSDTPNDTDDPDAPDDTDDTESNDPPADDKKIQFGEITLNIGCSSTLGGGVGHYVVFAAVILATLITALKNPRKKRR
ncbi:MAG: S8 family serine peptidase [Clostridiales bacterium]|jgi:subtilisin family serine protease|nr:S8 family serine peptidase [Clostridiales bacterium]